MPSVAIFVAAAVVIATWLMTKMERNAAALRRAGGEPDEHPPSPETKADKSLGADLRPFWKFAVVCGLIGLVLRLYGFHFSLWLDEFATLWIVEADWGDIIPRTLEFQPQSPLYYLVSWNFVKLLGESEIVLRIPPFLFGLGTIFCIFKVAELIADTKAGLLAAGLAALSPQLVEQSANARPYTLGLFLASVMLVGFAKAVLTGSRSGRILFILGGAGTFAAHYAVTLVSAGLGLSYLVLRQLRARYRPREFALDVVLQLLLVSPIMPHVWSVWVNRSEKDWAADPNFLEFFAMVGGPLVLAATGWAVGGPRTTSPRHALVNALWLCVAAPVAGLSLVSALGPNLLVERYLGTIVVPALVLAGEGARRIPRGTAAFPWAYWGVSVVVAFGTTLFLVGSFSKVGRQDWRGAVAAVDKIVRNQPEALVLFRSGFVEDDGRTTGFVTAGTQSPLRNPGERTPSWARIALPFRWSAPNNEEYYVREVKPRLESTEVFYFFGVNTFYEVTGDYPVELFGWINSHFPDRFEAHYIDVGRGMLLMRYQEKSEETVTPNNEPGTPRRDTPAARPLARYGIKRVSSVHRASLGIGGPLFPRICYNRTLVSLIKEKFMAENSRRLGDKVIIVTGSTQGLGEEIARQSEDLGAAGIVISGRNADRGTAVARSLSTNGCRSIFVEAELADIEACRGIVRRCDEEFGRVDGLVNSAACTERGTLEDTSPEHWDKIMAINVRAPFLLMQESVRLMKRAGNGGSIINILSVSAHGGQPKLTPYSVSKGALATLTKNAGHSLMPDRIRVNGINVGWMATPNEHAVQKSEGQPENWLEIAEANMPYGRILRPNDIAGLVTYLLSDAAQMMNGALIDYDQHVMGIFDP